MCAEVTPGQLGMATPFGDLLGMSDAEMNAELADYVKMGVDWVRTDIWWRDIEWNKGTYNWGNFDKVVNAANAHGIKVVGELLGAPNWVESSGGMHNDANTAAYGAFAKAAAQHFSGKISHWEIWNEPNLRGFWSNPNPADYTKALKAAYTSIKAVDPGATVITGGLSPSPETLAGSHVGAVDFLKGVYANDGKGYFDAVGFHPYSWPLQPSDPAAWNGWEIMERGVRDTMVANGDSAKKVWMTEMGAPTGGGGASVSQAAQAQMLKEATDIAHATPWAGPLMWYSYKDYGGSTSDTEKWFGLLGPNGEHKTSYTTYQSIATQDNGTTTPPQPPQPPPPPPPTTETPTFTGTSYSGNSLDNVIIGNSLNNFINGNAGNDTIKGGAGNDMLLGGPGNDTIAGGAGTDTLDFNSVSTIGNDTFLDFQKGDKFDLRDMDANSTLAGNQAFRFIGSNWLAKPGDLGFYQDPGANKTSIQGDTNGDGRYDFNITVQGVHTFVAGDIIL